MSPVLCLALWLSALQVRPAPRPDAAPPRASIQGIVVRAGAAAGAREGLAAAQVELKPGNVSVFTDPDGVFTLRNLAPGRYTISVKHDGFILQEDRRRGLTESGLNLTVLAGQTIKDIVLPMVPAPVISGKVIDPHGEPLAAALVRTYKRRYTPNGTQLRAIRKGMTDDMGEFRLFGLTFGEYFVSAGYGDRDRAAGIGNARLSTNVSKADDGYATMFYDGSEDISRARVAHLAPGFDLGTLNIYLTDSGRFKIRGQVLPLIGGTKIMLAPQGSDLTETEYFTAPNARGEFEVGGLSPGSYLLFATAAGDTMSSDVIPVNVTDRDIDGVRLALTQTIPIAGGVFWEGNPRENFSELQVTLVRSNPEFDQKIDARPAPDGTFVFEHVSTQAEYDVAIQPPAGAYVKSITSGIRNVMAGKSRLVQSLRIVLASATDALDVRATKGNDRAPGVLVVLIPEPSLRRRADRYITGFTEDSGSLTLSAVPPGRYTAYAFEQIEADAYYALAYNPAAGERFRDRAVAVTVGEGGTKAIQLSVIPAAETAGGLQ
jgi:hypothetical protein